MVLPPHTIETPQKPDATNQGLKKAIHQPPKWMPDGTTDSEKLCLLPNMWCAFGTVKTVVNSIFRFPESQKTLQEKYPETGVLRAPPITPSKKYKYWKCDENRLIWKSSWRLICDIFSHLFPESEIKWPKGAQMEPKGTTMEPQGHSKPTKTAQMFSKDDKRDPRVPQRSPKDDKTEPQGHPKC